MTDIIIVHSKHGNSKNHWYEWLRHNLTLKGMMFLYLILKQTIMLKLMSGLMK